MANRDERKALREYAIREGLSLSDGSRMKVADAYVMTSESVIVATGWRTSSLVKFVRWRLWVTTGLAGLSAGWLNFAWWQFAVLAGIAVVVIKFAVCILGAWWYREHFATAPAPGERDDATMERWSHDDRNLASRWLGQGGWIEVMPMGYDYPLVDWSKRLQTFTPWVLAQFTVAGLVWGTAMWSVRSAADWLLG